MTDGLAVQLAESLEAAAARKELAHFDEVASLRKELAQARADVAFLRSRLKTENAYWVSQVQALRERLLEVETELSIRNTEFAP